jgi:hypothetical protein
MNNFIKKPIGRSAQWLIDTAKVNGLDFSELTHEITSHFHTHVMNRHGKQSPSGQPAITEADFQKIPDILQIPDFAIIGASRNGLCNAYTKQIDGETFLYFEEILNSRRNKSLRGKTFYKLIGPLTLDQFKKKVTLNEKTDISKAKIVAVGGNPGEEAE